MSYIFSKKMSEKIFPKHIISILKILLNKNYDSCLEALNLMSPNLQNNLTDYGEKYDPGFLSQLNNDRTDTNLVNINNNQENNHRKSHNLKSPTLLKKVSINSKNQQNANNLDNKIGSNQDFINCNSNENNHIRKFIVFYLNILNSVGIFLFIVIFPRQYYFII